MRAMALLRIDISQGLLQHSFTFEHLVIIAFAVHEPNLLRGIGVLQLRTRPEGLIQLRLILVLLVG